MISSILFNYFFPCVQPLQYSIGKVDKKFNLKLPKIKKIILASEKIWETKTEQNMFEYNKDAKLKINFIFDERQENKIKSENEQNRLKQNLDKIKETESNYANLTQQYKDQTAQYQKVLLQYQNHQKIYNTKVLQWNRQKTKTSAQYQQLMTEKSNLQQEYNKLETLRLDINKTAKQINILADQEKQLVEQHNKNVKIFNHQFAQDREFDQGNYFKNDINIYYFNNQDDLKLVIAHELGHALNFSHVENDKSIMYYLMKNQNLNNIEPSKQDIEEVEKKCKFGNQKKFERLLFFTNKIGFLKISQRINNLFFNFINFLHSNVL